MEGQKNAKIPTRNSRAGYRDKFCVLYSLCLLAARSADADQSEAFLKNGAILIGLEIECEPDSVSDISNHLDKFTTCQYKGNTGSGSVSIKTRFRLVPLPTSV